MSILASDANLNSYVVPCRQFGSDSEDHEEARETYRAHVPQRRLAIGVPPPPIQSITITGIEIIFGSHSTPPSRRAVDGETTSGYPLP